METLWRTLVLTDITRTTPARIFFFVQKYYCFLCIQWEDFLSLPVCSPKQEVRKNLHTRGSENNSEWGSWIRMRTSVGLYLLYVDHLRRSLPFLIDHQDRKLGEFPHDPNRWKKDPLARGNTHSMKRVDKWNDGPPLATIFLYLSKLAEHKW